MPDYINSPITPLPQSLNRVSVKDGLLLTAELWQTAHDYHRQRHNLIYQSFYTSGIITGLGVSVIQPPRDIPANYRDFRWLRIQPGIAIDMLGNLIIVPEPIEFRIASTLQDRLLTVYLVISYVDPQELQGNGNGNGNSEKQIVTETFRIDEKVNPPQNLDVELCRIVLPENTDQLAKDYLANPRNVFEPEIRCLDLRYRQVAQLKVTKFFRVAQLIGEDEQMIRINNNFASLQRSLSGLYPQMDGNPEVNTIDLQPDYSDNYDLSARIRQYNICLVYLTYQQAQNLSQQEIEILKLWSNSGSTILIEYSTGNNSIGELKTVEQQLVKIITDLENTPNLTAEINTYQQELNLIRNSIQQQLSSIITECQRIGQILEIEMSHSGIIEAKQQHLLLTQPFLFTNFPVFQQQSIEFYNWQNLILVIGNLTDSWGVNNQLFRSRENIRSCQEMGINLLHFAWQFHHLTNLYKN